MNRWRNFLINWAENARLAFERLILPPHKRQRAQHNQTRHRWFYKAAWQRLEQEAEADLREGRYEDFKEIGELIGVLRQNNALEPVGPTSNFDRIALPCATLCGARRVACAAHTAASAIGVKANP
ncbi:MAG: hypothetical protein HC853_15445 [Anaerolineae bacterium]|nr:hypothetical protein [Anaerolineae bacterium]